MEELRFSDQDTLKMLSFSTLAYQRDLDLRLRMVQVECERQKIL